jgi:mRNA interferase MazF
MGKLGRRSMAKKQKITHPKRGEIYLVNFDPTIGSEIKKTRPALILQNDISNQYSPITIVAAITSQFDDELYPTEVLVKAPEGGLTDDSVVLLNQIRSIDKQRLMKRIGALTKDTMTQVDLALQISFGLIEL